MFALTASSTFAQDIKRSRFVAIAGPIDDEAAARQFLAQHSSTDANHNCWAWRIGQSYRFNDDGEPSGTAGKPILQALDAAELDRVVVVVTRWFGGVLLGSGGLIRAYGGTAAACLQAAPKVRIVPSVAVTIDVAFSDLALLKARLAALPDVSLSGERFTHRGAVLDVSIPQQSADSVLQMITDLTSGRAIIA